MRHDFTNRDDSLRDDKYIDDLVDKMKALGFSIKKNSKKTCVLGVMVGSMILSGFTLKKTCGDVKDFFDYYKIITTSNDEMIENNNEVILESLDDTIMVANVDFSVEQDYYFNDGYLYNKDGEIISLEGEEKKICFVKCNIDSTISENINLAKASTKVLDLTYSSIDNECIKKFPSTLEFLRLDECNYITNLNGLGEVCPNLKWLSINNAVSLNDLSFIYDLDNLEEIYIGSCAYVDEKILTYLKENNITTNLTEEDVINTKEIDEIVNNIILDGMSDREKIQAVCLYVLDKVEYDIAYLRQSNEKPLECILNDGKGVCMSYAYFTNILLDKAGIKTYCVIDNNHAWNMVYVDSEYYYIDTTNMDDSLINKKLLEFLNIAKHYMADPENVTFSSMSSVSSEDTIITASLVDDVLKGMNNKDIFEKYGNVVLSGSFSLGSLFLMMILGLNMRWLVTGKHFKIGKKICSDIKRDYLYRLRERLLENRNRDIRYVDINGDRLVIESIKYDYREDISSIDGSDKKNIVGDFEKYYMDDSGKIRYGKKIYEKRNMKR